MYCPVLSSPCARSECLNVYLPPSYSSSLFFFISSFGLVQIRPLNFFIWHPYKESKKSLVDHFEGKTKLITARVKQRSIEVKNSNFRYTSGSTAIWEQTSRVCMNFEKLSLHFKWDFIRHLRAHSMCWMFRKWLESSRQGKSIRRPSKPRSDHAVLKKTSIEGAIGQSDSVSSNTHSFIHCIGLYFSFSSVESI